MNCKPDQLAIFVKSAVGNEGRIVRCLRLATWEDLRKARLHATAPKWPIWVIDQDVTVSLTGRVGPFAQDRNLRPITPPPGSVTTDEVAALYSPKVKEAV